MSKPAACTLANACAANSGVPAKMTFIDSLRNGGRRP
jgi:hypothetical protein